MRVCFGPMLNNSATKRLPHEVHKQCSFGPMLNNSATKLDEAEREKARQFWTYIKQ